MAFSVLLDKVRCQCITVTYAVHPFTGIGGDGKQRICFPKEGSVFNRGFRIVITPFIGALMSQTVISYYTMRLG